MRIGETNLLRSECETEPRCRWNLRNARCRLGAVRDTRRAGNKYEKEEKRRAAGATGSDLLQSKGEENGVDARTDVTPAGKSLLLFSIRRRGKT